MEKKRILVLTAAWNTRVNFIDELRYKLDSNNNCIVHSLGGINAMDDIVAILDWERKQDQSKINKLAQELYKAWQDIDDEALNEAITFINDCKGANNLIVINAITDELLQSKLEGYYPHQIVYFEVSINDEATLETELERLINVKQLRLKQYIND